jgi:hypothetical protein
LVQNVLFGASCSFRAGQLIAARLSRQMMRTPAANSVGVQKNVCEGDLNCHDDDGLDYFNAPLLGPFLALAIPLPTLPHDIHVTNLRLLI